MRPVGTEFEYEYPPSPTSTDTAGSVFTYRVVAHVLVDRFPGDPVGELREQLEAIAVHYEKGG